MNKPYIVVVSILASVIAFGLIAATLMGSKPADKSSADTINGTSISPPDAENIPLYPNAKEIDNINPWKDETRYTNFKVDATVEQIWVFYDNQLPKQGWAFDGENKAYGLRGYVWSDDKGRLPWTLELGIKAVELRGSAIPPVDIGLTAVHISLDRVPVRNVEILPTYPGAQQSTGTYIHYSYQASATPAEITAFYKDTLTQFGWSFTEESSDGMSKRLHFGWSSGFVESMRFSGLSVALEQEEGNVTKVKIELDKSSRYDPTRAR